MSDPSDAQPRLARRDFLKLGAIGTAASVAGCGPAPTPAGPTPPKEAPEQDGQVPPAVGDLIDPLRSPENWQEPWIWRPEEWPQASLELNVVENQSPGGSSSPGNPAPTLFSYNGSPMGPTVRVKGDGTVRIRVRNLLGLNEQMSHLGPSPDPVDMPLDTDREVCRLREMQRPGGDPENPQPCNPFLLPELLLQVISPEARPGWSLKGPVNGQHRTHTTNLHTHGLHVPPDRNGDGSHSDNVFLRIIPRADLSARRNSGDPELAELGPDEHVAELEYKIELAQPGAERAPHPPGTHWYHPHSHGATHDQVASGMAGFLIVEGDVDEAVNRHMTGEAWPDPAVPTGPWGYRERLVFIQRVFVGSVDLDAGRRRNNLRFPPLTAVNGVAPASVIRMRPGAIERWRVLNGSVDGAGTKRVMVLEGQFVQRDSKIWRVVTEGAGPEQTRRLEAVNEQTFEDAKVQLRQLSFDGITLVEETEDGPRHVIRDLGAVNAGTDNPMARRRREDETEIEATLKAFEDCYRDGDSLRRAYVRPNELYLGNANRADIFFTAPRDGAGKVYTIFAKEAHLHTDNYQSVLQTGVTNPEPLARRPPFDVVVAYVAVSGEPVDVDDVDFAILEDELPPVPALFRPVQAEELRIARDEALGRGLPEGACRARVISYSGTGGADFPVIVPPASFCEGHPELEHLVWGTQDGQRILLANLTRTMGINSDFDLSSGVEPRTPRKFMPDDPFRSKVLVGTAEEWVLYNSSLPMWSHTDRDRFPQPGSYRQHYESFPMSRAEGQRRFWEDPEFQITVKASDHPFHIHINPMWVLRIDVPDEEGNLHNVLPEPRWMDTVPIPRDGGRVVFRTRFDDFVGRWVHHCHILLHEDMGMMQTVECLDDPSEANYVLRDRAAGHDTPADEVDRLYPQPSRALRYRQTMSFDDPNELGGQLYPGFDISVPELED